jgi:hypothetical protein
MKTLVLGINIYEVLRIGDIYRDEGEGGGAVERKESFNRQHGSDTSDRVRVVLRRIVAIRAVYIISDPI